MKIERTKNATRNIAWGMIEKTVNIVLPFVARTVFIYILGSEYLGLNSLFTSILSVLSLTELGVGSALVFSMYKPIAEDDSDTICALMNLYRRVYRIIGTIITVVGLSITPFITYFIKDKAYPSDINIYVLYLMYLFNTTISYFLFSYKTSLLRAHQRGDVTSKITTGLTFVQQILQIILIAIFKNYYAYVIIQPIFVVIANLINAYKVNQMYPQYKCYGEISKELKDDIKKKIVGLLSYKIYGVIFASVDTIVISRYLGLTQLAIYQNYYYVLNAIVGFVGVFTTSLVAGIGNSMATETVDKNYNDFKKIVFLNGWIISFCSISLMCLYQPFMMLWVGEKLMFPFPTMVLVVLYFYIPRVTTMSYVYREAAGLWWEDRLRPIVATVVNLVLNIALVQVIGMNGVILSTLFCSVFINIPWGTHILFKNYFKRSEAEYFLNLFKYTIITLIMAVITYGICLMIGNTGFVKFFIKMIVCLVVPNAGFALVYRSDEYFQFAIEFVNKLIFKIKNRFFKRIIIR